MFVRFPSHIHGHKFQIVGRSTDYQSDDPTLNPPIVEGQANPMRRDTIQIPTLESVTLRFIADNPGAWFFHCKSSTTRDNMSTSPVIPPDTDHHYLH